MIIGLARYSIFTTDMRRSLGDPDEILSLNKHVQRIVVMDGMHAEWYIESTLNKIGLRLAGWLGLPVGARVGTRVFKTFLRHNTNQYFEPCFRSKCLFVNLFELVVLLTGSFDNMIHHLGIMPRAWLKSTFIRCSERA